MIDVTGAASTTSDPTTSLASVAVVVPTRNEAVNIRELHRRLTHTLSGMDWALVIVDDSDDRTVHLLDELALNDSRVTVIRRDRSAQRSGRGGAITCGLAHASKSGAAAIVVMAADLQHPADLVPQLVETMTEKYADIVVASRYVDGAWQRGAGVGRELLSRLMRRVAIVALDRARSVHDPLSGFFAVRPDVIRDVDLSPDGHKVLLDVLVRGRWSRIAEIPFVSGPRRGGRSKATVVDGLHFLRHVRELSSARPARHAAAHADPDRLLRVLILTSEAPPVMSGISRSVAMLSEGLRGRGHQVDIISRADFPRLSRREIRLSSFGFFWPSFRKLLSQYDVVNVHGPVPTMSETFLWLIKSLPEGSRPGIVYTHHSDIAIPGLGRASELYNRSTRKLAHVADAIVVTSDHYHRKLSELRGAPLHVIPWAVDVMRPAPRPTDRVEGPLRALFVGQLRPYKGLTELLTAAGELPEVQFTIVGDGPMREALELRIKRERLDNVQMTGRISDEALWAAYAAADTIVLPSTTTAEAYGLVLIEGMAAGCVPIASDLPGVRGVAGPTGVLVPPRDAHALARALRELAADPERLARLAAASHAAVQTYDLSDMTDSYERVLGQVAGMITRRHSAVVTPSEWPDPQTFLAHVNETLGTSDASLSLVDPTTGHGRVWRRTPHPSIEATPVAAYAARQLRPLLIQGGTKDPALAKLLRRGDVTSSMVIPLHVGADRVAVLAASTTADSPHLLDEDAMNVAIGLLRSGSVGRTAANGNGVALNPESYEDHSARIRLVVDGRVLHSRYNGIGRVVFELLKVLVHRDDIDIVVLTGPDIPPHFDLDALAATGGLHIHPVDIPLFGPSHFWKLERVLRALRADAVFYPYHLVSPVGPGTPRVTMIHDCIFESDPASYYSPRTLPLYRALTRAVLNSSEVVTISETSAHEVERFYGVRVAAESVARLGIDPAFTSRAPGHSVREQFGVPPRFLLTVGVRRPHKNLAVLVRAMMLLPEDIHLVCVGWVDERFDDPVPALIESLELSHRVHHLSSISDAELAGLYQEATAVACPSRIEGFGLPVLEAMVSGTPVIASSIPVFAEIAGDAAVLVSPDIPRQWADAVMAILADDTHRDEMIGRGLAQATSYTWERAADAVVWSVRRAAIRAPGRLLT